MASITVIARKMLGTCTYFHENVKPRSTAYSLKNIVTRIKVVEWYEWVFSITTKKTDRKKKKNSIQNETKNINPITIFFFFHFSMNWNEKYRIQIIWNDRRINIRKASIKMSVHIGKQMIDDESSENRLQNVSQSEIGNTAASYLM